VFKIGYKIYKLGHGRNMVVPTSSREKEKRLRARSLGRTLKNVRSVI
jgi:hypothetical protein